MRASYNDMIDKSIGKQFGEWTITGRAFQRGYAFCRCSCGKEQVIPYNSLVYKRTSRCRACANRLNTREAKHERNSSSDAVEQQIKPGQQNTRMGNGRGNQARSAGGPYAGATE